MSNNQELMNITIDRVVTHAHKSKYQSWYVRDFDLSLARLSRPIRLKDNFAEPICLPKEPIDSDITCFMTIPDVPEPISFIVTESNTCNAPHHYNNTILGHNFCALLQPDSISNDDKSPVVVVNEKSPGISANSSCADMLSSISHKSINIDYRLPEFAAGSPLICLSRHSQWFVAGFINFIDSRPRSLRHPAVFVNNFALRSFVDRVTGMTRYRRPLSYPVVAYKLVSNTTQSNHSISTNYNQLNQSIDSVYQLLANANATLLPSSPTSSMTVVEHGAITLLTSSNQRSISFPLSNQTHNAWMTLNTSINSNLPNHSITQSNNSIAFITHNSTDSTTLGQHPLVNSANSTLWKSN